MRTPGPFFGELYLRSTRPFLPDEVTRTEAEYLSRAFDRVRVEGPVLDVGCGHGRHLAHLQTRRLKIGVDFDPLSLAEVKGPAVRADFFKLPLRTASIAAAWSWYNTLFIFEDHEQRTLLREIARVLKPGAVFVAQGLARQYIESRPHAQYDDHIPDGSRLIESSRFDPKTGRDVAERKLITPEGRTLVARYFIRYYYRDEMVALIEQAGLKVKWVHGGIDESPHGPDSMDLIVGAERA